MKIIEYEDKYLEDVKDLLVELEEYILSIDEDNLDQLHPEYRDKMAMLDLEEVKNNNGKCYLAIDNDVVVGLIMGCLRSYDEYDYLDYKCPKCGEITELVVSKKVRSSGIGTLLMNKIEEYFKGIGCEYISIEVFAYNKMGINFYEKHGYHTRGLFDIKKINWVNVRKLVDLEILLSSGTKIWIYYLDNDFVCSMMSIPSSEKDMVKFGLDFDYREVIDYGPMFVNPKYVGNNLQYQMLKYLDEYVKSKGYGTAIWTIHPDNIYSINNLIKDGFVLTDQRNFKRGTRNIYVKKLINK